MDFFSIIILLLLFFSISFLARQINGHSRIFKQKKIVQRKRAFTQRNWTKSGNPFFLNGDLYMFHVERLFKVFWELQQFYSFRNKHDFSYCAHQSIGLKKKKSDLIRDNQFFRKCCNFAYILPLVLAIVSNSPYNQEVTFLKNESVIIPDIKVRHFF